MKFLSQTSNHSENRDFYTTDRPVCILQACVINYIDIGL